MQIHKMTKMKMGWFVGDFEPTAFKTSAFEVAVKHYASGVNEKCHVHKRATEVTLIISGSVRINGVELQAGDIAVLQPNESSAFETLTASTTVVVKSPSIPGDKFFIEKVE